MTRRRRFAGVVLIPVGILLVVSAGACSSHGSHSASATTGSTSLTTPQPSTSTTAQATSPASVPPGSVSPSTSAPAPVTSCRTADLTISSGILGGAAGTQEFELAFRNRAGIACVLTGYPGVSFLDASGSQIGLPAERITQAHGTVTLAPATTAYAQVGVGNPAVNACPAATARQIRVFPPNETVAALVAPPAGLLICTRQTVSAFISPVVDKANG